MNKFSNYLREYIGFYMWKMNIAEVNRQYLQNFKGFGRGSPLNFLSTHINGYFKNYNWRVPSLTKYDMDNTTKINVGSAFCSKKGEAHRDKIARIRRECLTIPPRYWVSVLPSDLIFL